MAEMPTWKEHFPIAWVDDHFVTRREFTRSLVWVSAATFLANLALALLNQIRGLLGGALIQLPATVEELRTPASAADIERYVRWPHASGEVRVKLLKLLWDAVGSEFASRHLQYEMFYAGEPAAIHLREFRNFDWAAAEELVDSCLAGYDKYTL